MIPSICIYDGWYLALIAQHGVGWILSGFDVYIKRIEHGNGIWPPGPNSYHILTGFFSRRLGPQLPKCIT
jgi:hypothetical protein